MFNYDYCADFIIRLLPRYGDPNCMYFKDCSSYCECWLEVIGPKRASLSSDSLKDLLVVCPSLEFAWVGLVTIVS